MKNYVLAFVFTADRSKVALIRKNHPNWQAGDLNGIGGKVLMGEDWLSALHREWVEETGTRLFPQSWKPIVHEVGHDYAMVVSSYFLEVEDHPAFKAADEQVSWYKVKDVMTREDTVKGVKWMIQLALDDPANPVKVST